MKERQLICNAREVRAIQSGAMTQFRRILKPQPELLYRITGDSRNSHYHKGMRLWVREAWSIDPHPGQNYSGGLRSPDGGEVMYRATDGWHGPWRPSIHMPRWASRITLEITSVRVERLQAISEADAVAEGVTAVSSGGVTLFTTTGVNCFQTAKDAYAALWESINGPDSWGANPWVWRISFKVIWRAK